MLPFKTLPAIFMRPFKEYGKDDGGHLAAALAFAHLSSLFPLILFLVSPAGKVVARLRPPMSRDDPPLIQAIEAHLPALPPSLRPLRGFGLTGTAIALPATAHTELWYVR